MRLKESEEQMRELLDNLRQAVYRMSVPDGEYLFLSSAVQDVFGRGLDEIRATPGIAEQMMHPDFRDYFRQEWGKLLRGEVSPEYEYKILDPAGQDRWIFQNNAAVRGPDGKSRR